MRKTVWILLFIGSFLMGQNGGSIYSIGVKTIDGASTTLEPYRGKVMLIVNTASKCGFTSQFAGLETLYRRYKGRGFVVLGFPCNQFASQEPLSEPQIRNFCQVNYGVTFPMFAKIDVNGPNAHPLYSHLKQSAPGILRSEAIKWNFTKFLVDREGRVVRRYAPSTKPEEIASDIEKFF